MHARDDTNNYWRTLRYALRDAQRRAAREGRRYRVQRVTWESPSRLRKNWYVAPTPAPGPSRVAVEPCS